LREARRAFQDDARAINEITVNGHEFNGVMPAWSLSDEDIADVLTYVYNTWGNSGLEVTPAEVNAYRVKATQ